MQDRKQAQKRQTRLASIVILLAVVSWLVGSWAGAQGALSMRTVVLFDLVALAGFAFAVILLVQVWRQRRNEGDS